MHVSNVHATEDLLFSILTQLIIMIGAARIMNTVVRRIGQPGVIGEILAGLMLGPSLFGHFFPGASLAIFGAKASPPITVLSQVGLILLMFQIGMDFEFGHLARGRGRRGVGMIALASIAVPFLLGLGIGRVSAPMLAPTIDPTIYSLFLGVGMAITAVPILGRILRQFDLNRTELGTVAISAAALNDVVGWVMLAGISALAAAKFSGGHAALQVAGILGFFGALWFGVRPLTDRLLAAMPLRDGLIAPNLMAIVIALAFACGIVTYKLGIFAIFGGFAAGLLFHRHASFVDAWRRQVGAFVLVFFLPVFFCFTGLRTNVLGLSTGVDIEWLTVILAAAILGKIVPVYVAARAAGFDRPQSSILGTLMNTRALMELIVLNIGLDLGFLPGNVFTMMVIMAVVTTIMTGPLLQALLPRIGHAVPVGVEA